jgi:hypothetical protein
MVNNMYVPMYLMDNMVDGGKEKEREKGERKDT